ncbi:MAG: Gfo/Idh/MocA family oxidoreductase [Clostridia bacterium]|nr:Gfo/Idh/MocA family oxidoreductase [Clostridia bacterium]
MNNYINIAIIGFGGRGTGLLQSEILPMCERDIRVVSVCDVYEDRAKRAADIVEKAGYPRPAAFTDYKEAIAVSGLKAVVISSAWESHLEVAMAAMKAGLQAATEVGGAYSVEDCWQLVRTYEETGKHCMLLENCCYGREELSVLNMVRSGLFGTIVHCAGGYHHDLRGEITYGKEERHYRLRNYINRNCENYPTHEFGPIAKVLDINNGNRIMTLNSVASCSKGLHEFVMRGEHKDTPLANVNFYQGDVVTTILKCQCGQTVVLTLDTSMARPYSRGFTIRGTNGFYCEDNYSVFLDEVHDDFIWSQNGMWGNAEEYVEKYKHKIWENYSAHGGHGGMDWLVLSAFFESVRTQTRPPIDTYDTATYMAITALSEQSIALSGATVFFPDFTRGKWYHRNDIEDTMFNLDKLEPFADLYQY